MTPTATMIEILERRAQRLHLELTILAREIAVKRDNLATLEATIAAVNRRACENGSARFADGARSVAALLELEKNSQSLRASATELVTLKERCEQALEMLVGQQRTVSQRWHREEIRREYVTRLARRERVRAETKQFDADDESFVERSGNGSSKLLRLAECR